MKHYNFNEIIAREQTNCVKYDLRKMFFGTEDVLPMWVADMDFRTPDFIIDAIKSRLDHEILGYSIRGEAFNESIAGWMKKRHDWEIQQDWISFSPGVVPALNMLVLAFTKPGDKIIVQPPVYFPFFMAIENNDRQKVENQLKLENGRLCMDFQDLKKKARDAAMIFISHPHNPGGSVWTKEELAELAEICLKNNVLMVSDEIHSDLLFEGFKHVPLASLSDEIAMQTITCNAASKTFNLAGLATSYLIIPNKGLLDRYNRILNDELHINMGNLFGPIALNSAYQHGEGWLGQLLEYVWLDCRELRLTGDELKDFFINAAKVGFNDGRVFGTGGEGFMRMNVACPRPMVKEALGQIKDAVVSDAG